MPRPTKSSGSYELHDRSKEASSVALPYENGVSSSEQVGNIDKADKDASKTQAGPGGWGEDLDESQYPSGLQFALIIFSLFISVFIVAVSQTVLATAIPTITSAFNSFDDIAWYSTGEQITAVAMQLPFGRAYTLANNKWIFLVSVIIYLAGSAICGFAPVSVVLIIGRVIQGVGMAGVFGGSFIVLARVTPLRKRSLWCDDYWSLLEMVLLVFQSINGDSAQSSGFKQIALCISTAIASIVAGGMVVALGFYNPFIIVGSMLVTAGSALYMVIKPDANLGMVIGAQILVGAGVGVGAEQANVAVQTVLPSEKIAKGTSLTLFTRLLGVALSVPVAQSVIQQELVKALGPSLAGVVYGDGGAPDLRMKLQTMFGDNTPAFQSALNGVNYAITRTFMLAMILAAISFPFGLLVEWKSVKKEKRAEEDQKERGGNPKVN
ncbi:hypothetical protein CBS470a_003922 [Colletotrichum nupharicola]|nr:hypothetical protein CBS470a_003922 [Colletotrichum nupharicola]